MKLKHIARATVLVLLVAFAINICYKALSWKDTTGGYLSAYSQLYHTPENTMDVVFLGTSHVYCDIYPSILWRDYGVAGFDMAVSGQDRMSAYYSLKELLKTQSPKIVLVDLFALHFDGQVDHANEYRNLMGMKYSKNMLDHVKSYDANPNVNRVDYLLRFPIIHTRYKELTKYDFVQYGPSVYGKGEDIYFENRAWNEGDEQAYSKTTEVAELSESELQWLEDLKKLSKDYGFELGFTILPTNADDALQARWNAVKLWTDENNIPLYDFNQQREAIGITNQGDYLDAGHLNAFGAEKMSRYLYDTVLSPAGVENHKGDERYQSWEDNLKRFRHMQVKQNLASVRNREDYLAIAETAEDLTILLSTASGYTLYENGKTYELTAEQLTNGFALNLGKTDNAYIKKDLSKNQDTLLYNAELVESTTDGSKILVYDNFLEEKMPMADF